MELMILEVSHIKAIHQRVLFESERQGECPRRIEGVIGPIYNRLAYGIASNHVFDLAGCYGAHIAIGYAFVEGNKCTAFQTLITLWCQSKYA
jgi:prophage maintenance system killer protein